MLATEQVADELIGDTGFTRVQDEDETRVIEEGNFTVITEDEGMLWLGFRLT